jgi:hypothetical protein
MTPLQLATLALYLAALAAASALAGRDRRAIPVVGYLGAVVAIDLLQLLRAALLPPATGIRTGWDLVLRQAEVGLYVGSMLALPAMAVALFPRLRTKSSSDNARLQPSFPRGRPAVSKYMNHLGYLWVANSPRGFLTAWLTLWLLIAGSYPDLRGPALLRIYDFVELGAIVVVLACVGAWIRSGRVIDEHRSPAHLAGLALIAGPAATNLVAWFPGGDVLEEWRFVVGANAVAVGTSLVLLLWGLTRAGRRRCTS